MEGAQRVTVIRVGDPLEEEESSTTLIAEIVRRSQHVKISVITVFLEALCQDFAGSGSTVSLVVVG